MSETTPQAMPDRTLPTRAAISAALVALLLVALGDALLFGHAPGLNLFLFALAIGAGILLVNRHHLTRAGRLVAVLAPLLILPLVETFSLPGFLVASLGLSLLALGSRGLLSRRIETLPRLLLRYGLPAPFRLLADTIRTMRHGLDRRLGRVLARSLIAWIVPIIFAGVFVLLFANANPIIDSLLQQLDPDALLALFDPARIALWLVLAAVVWSLLRPKLLRWRKRSKPQGVFAVDAVPPTESILFGRTAILRSLVVFNAIFAIQTLLDLTYLWGGVALPEGMSHADYAHRGAYPLIVTALLAAAFVLAAMRKNGPGEQSPLIRRLVYAWIAQNVLLCISSILRLDLYVEVYSLTELRLAAVIWMGLVAMGLLLILARIVLRQSNGWLVGANVIALTVVLYGCAFFDFSAFIARFNVDHSLEISGQGLQLDGDYLLALGPSVLPALDDFLAEATLDDDRRAQLTANRRYLVREAKGPDDWRSWTFRNWRQHHYATGDLAIAPPARSGIY